MDRKQSLSDLARIRLLKHPESTTSFLFAESERAGLVGGSNSSIIADADGIYVNGRIGFSALPQDVKFGPAWRMNPALISTIPSTITSPIPVLQFSFPGVEMISTFTSIVNTAAGFLV